MTVLGAEMALQGGPAFMWHSSWTHSEGVLMNPDISCCRVRARTPVPPPPPPPPGRHNQMTAPGAGHVSACPAVSQKNKAL